MTMKKKTRPPIRLLLVGATGAVGQQVLAQALADKRVSEVVAITRRALPAQSRLKNVVGDFDALPEDADCWHVGAVICTLGTTIKIAGSQAAFAKVDRDLPLLVARRSQAMGATRFGIVSSLGANVASSTFYLRTKGEVESGIASTGFASVTIARPSLIDARRSDVRRGESLGLLAARVLRPLIPKRYQVVTAQAIAAALLQGVLAGRPGVEVIESDALQAFASLASGPASARAR